MKRSKFSLSNYKLATFDMGQLVPVGLTEVLPGDSIQQATSALIRCSPLLAPVMHPVKMRIHHWFVPNRILWDNWEDFITGGPDGMNASVFPTITINNPAEKTLADYMGIAPGTYSSTFSALPFRAYAMIFNEWYRDQDLVTEVGLSKADGNDTTTNTSLLYSAWEKDYFTTARPWEHKGPAVTLPLGTEAPILRRSNAIAAKVYAEGTNSPGGLENLRSDAAGVLEGATSSTQFSIDPQGGLYASLSGATAANVNDLRLAMALQRYQEARARYGSRYTEYLRYLGVRSSDARLQRPEYLGGGKQTIQFSEVLQTGVDSTDEGVGDMYGHGIGAMRSNRYRRFFEEHGFIVSLVSVLPKTMYAQGMPRHWNRRTKEDFWQKELQHIGQQEILNKEVYAMHASPNDTFGFNDRYDEYRRAESTIAGEFRSTLNYWHMARIFGSAPTLNGDFVKANPTDRIFASTTTSELYGMFNHSIQARRLLAPLGTSFIY